MRYNELEKLLKKAGCYSLGVTQNGHPQWYSPITNRKFKMSHHGKQEVAKGTLKAILKSAGIN